MSRRKTKNSTGKKQNTTPVFTRWKNRIAQQSPILRFWLAFAGIMAFFYIIVVQPFYADHVQEPVSAFFAWAASSLLNLLGQSTEATGMNINAPAYTLTIKKGCDAIAPVVLVLTGILLFPATRKQKLLGIITGIAVLFGLNLLRIISLYFIGIHAPAYFEFMHIEFWQVVFISLALLYFFYWLNTVTKSTSHEQVT